MIYEFASDNEMMREGALISFALHDLYRTKTAYEQ